MGPDQDETTRALAMLPTSPWVLSSQFEATRTGVLVRRVMQCADTPMCVCVALRKGSRIDPIIRDSHVFALSLMPADDKLLVKKFDCPEATDEDPFDSYRVVRLTTGCPIMAKAILALDCEVLAHVDLEADCELFVGKILNAQFPTPPTPPAAPPAAT